MSLSEVDKYFINQTIEFYSESGNLLYYSLSYKGNCVAVVYDKINKTITNTLFGEIEISDLLDVEELLNKLNE